MIVRWPWHRKKPPAHHPLPGWPAGAAYPDSLADDLQRHFYECLYAVAPAERGSSHWVMTADWYLECRKMASGYLPTVLWNPATSSELVLLGIPVQIRDGGGPPHLEPARI